MGSCGLCKCPKTDVDSIKTQIVEIEGKSNDHWTVLAVGVYLHANWSIRCGKSNFLFRKDAQFVKRIFNFFITTIFLQPFQL